MKIADWLFAQPDFDEDARRLGVRFVGVCNQTMLRIGPKGRVPPDKPQPTHMYTLKLPAGFAADEITLKIESVPDEVSEEDRLQKKLKEIAERSWYYDELGIITIEIGLSASLLNYIHSELPQFLQLAPESNVEEQKLWPYFSALGDFAKFIAKHIAVYSNICRVGSLTLLDGFVFVGTRQVSESRSYYSPLAQISQVETERGIRLLRQLDFKKNWDFYASLSGTFLGTPKKPIEIAVGNLTDLFDENFDSSGARNLIWSFAGLEALLADSESSIGSQLRQKLVALFGNQVDVADFEKEIAEIYRYRSKVIHGNVKENTVLRNQGCGFFAPTKENHETRTAIWLLVSVTQYCFQNRISEIKFKTVVI